ncbi:MAG TPA: CHAT domain-containing protein, partial [Thermoanaerobaculia bacterium]|nr:CHAT domain-containing protein [Thermoanaerobaculia bacterium]
ACLLDRRLDPATRQAVIEHAADCAACRFVLAESARWQGGRQRARPRRPARVRLVEGVTVAASLALVAGFGWWALGARHPDVAGVLAAAGPERSMPSRLAEAPYQAPPPTFRAVSDPSLGSPASWDLAAAARDALAAVERRPSTRARQALAAAYLALGNHGEAIALFEELAAAPEAPPDAQVDLAAALLARGIDNGEPVDVVRALETLDEALQAAPGDAAARFNRALALEELSLRAQALHGWEDYLEVDAASGWAAEARTRRERLRDAQVALEGDPAAAAEPPVGDLDQLARWAEAQPGIAARWMRAELLGQWAGQWQAGDRAAAEETLRRARAVAAAVAGRSGDSSLADALALLADGRQRDRLAPAHAAYGRAWKALDELSVDAAGDAFEAVAGSAALLGSGEAQWHRVGSLAAAVYAGGDADALRRQLSAALAEAPPPLARGYLLWLRGLVALRQGGNDAAIADLSAAFPLLRDAGERQNAAWIRYLESEALQIAGDVAGGWRARVEALRLLEGSSPRRGTTLLGAAVIASLEGAPATALAFQEEALPLLEQIRGGVEVAEAWLWRARILHQAGESARAREALGAAAALVGRVEQLDSSLGKGFRARHALTRALVGSGRNLEEDLRLVDQSLETIAKSLPFYESLLRQRRAELHLAAGHPEAARADLQAVLERAAELRLAPGRELWNDGRDIGREALEGALELDAEDFGDPLAALRTLLEYRASATGRESSGDPVAALRASLSPGEVAVVYAQLGTRMVVWRVDRRATSWVRPRLPRQPLARTIAEWTEALDQGRGEEAGGELSRLLLPFWSDEALPPRLRIVPDEALAGLPWAALPAPGTDARLVAATEVTVSPFGLGGREESFPAQAMLVVADASASRELARLPGARDEAASLRTLFPSTIVLLGDEARRDRVLEELPRAGVAHFATHAWAHPRIPALARLSFAPGADGRSWLQAHEIPGLDLARTSLVVLAGCSTARSPGSTGTAVHGLAQGFIAAGVPSVLGTLWQVEDEPTSRLFRAFYRHLAGGELPEAALRRAQLELSAAGVPPTDWAGFILLRG